MNLRKISLYIVFLIVGFVSCKKDDTPTIEPIVLRDRAEQNLADMDSLNKYLDTHYYNATDFASLPNPKISDIIIIKVLDGENVPSGYTKLKTAVGEPKKLVYKNIDYEYFVLELNKGGGDSPTFADNIRANYEGFTIDGAVFDSQGLVNPVQNLFDLTKVILGWTKVFPEFNTAESFVDNSDGTVSFTNTGMGMMFLPSGLAYFPDFTNSISPPLWYSPLIFKFELLQMFQNDHDGDGIPSYLEDLNGNGELVTADFLADDDTDGDGKPNYLDADDDNDGILTKNEITVTKITKPTVEEVKMVFLEYNRVLLNKIVKEQNGEFTGTIITFKDTDGVKPFDYLDKNY